VGTEVDDDELPYTGIKIPAWLLALIGAGLVLSGTGLVTLSRGGNSFGDR
jgi:LPXTG-motif cell wall-anchored protein